jgi:Protein of unknown function (DUF4232)
MRLIGKAIAVVSMMAMAVSGLLGCGSGSGSAGTSDAAGRKVPATLARSHSQGVGQSAPISKAIAARRTTPWRARRPGSEQIGARGCVPQEGRGEIGIYTDVAAPSCVRITGRQRATIVNRTTAYRRSEGTPLVVRLGPYSARLLPQQAALFGPVGRFLGRGYHAATINRKGRVGILVLPNRCAILRPEPGEPLCFKKDRTGRLRRWHRTEARLHAPACEGADLIVSAGGHSGVAAGTVYSRLTITNSSRRPCTVAGVPMVEAIDRRGKPVGRAEAVPSLRAGSRGGRLRVRLRGHGSATFTVTHNDGIGSGRCKTALTYGLRVTVPGTGPTQVVPLPLSYCPSPRGGLGLRVGRIE